jgi:hypothetical protein
MCGFYYEVFGFVSINGIYFTGDIICSFALYYGSFFKAYYLASYFYIILLSNPLYFPNTSPSPLSSPCYPFLLISTLQPTSFYCYSNFPPFSFNSCSCFSFSLFCLIFSISFCASFVFYYPFFIYCSQGENYFLAIDKDFMILSIIIICFGLL